MLWIIMGHTVYYSTSNSDFLRNVYDLDPAIPWLGIKTQGSFSHWTFQFVVTATLGVDTFFLLSGKLRQDP